MGKAVALTSSSGLATLSIALTAPTGQNGTAYTGNLVAAGGTAPYTFAKTAGSLPTGLTLAGAVISGTPTASGTFTFTIQCTDSSATPLVVSQVFSIFVGSSSTPPAPNVTVSTCITDSAPLGNGVGYTFHGVASLPSTWAQIGTIIINVITATGQRVQIGQYYPTGTSLTWQGNYSFSLLMSAAAQTGVAVEFVCYNSASVATTPAYTFTGITIPALSISALTGEDASTLLTSNPNYAARWQDSGGALHTCLNAHITVSQAMMVSLFTVSSVNGVIMQGWFPVPAGASVIQIGRQGQLTTYFPPTAVANDVVYFVAVPAAVPSLPGAPLPTGAGVYGSSAYDFNVAGPTTPASTAVTGAYFDVVTTLAAGPGGTGLWGWTNLFATVINDPQLWFIRFTMQTGRYVGGVWTPGGPHGSNTPDAQGRLGDGFADWDTGEGGSSGVPISVSIVSQTSSITTISVKNPNTWGVPSDGNVVYKIRCYATSRAGGPAGTTTFEQCWSSGVGVSTPGIATSQDITLTGSLSNIATDASLAVNSSGQLGIPTPASPVSIGVIGTVNPNTGVMTFSVTVAQPVGAVGVHLYVEVPDRSATAPDAMGVTPVGTAPVTGAWNPIDLGVQMFSALQPWVVTALAPPGLALTAAIPSRMYASSITAAVDNPLVQAGLAGATPSTTFTLSPLVSNALVAGTNVTVTSGIVSATVLATDSTTGILMWPVLVTVATVPSTIPGWCAQLVITWQGADPTVPANQTVVSGVFSAAGTVYGSPDKIATPHSFAITSNTIQALTIWVQSGLVNAAGAYVWNNIVPGITPSCVVTVGSANGYTINGVAITAQSIAVQQFANSISPISIFTVNPALPSVNYPPGAFGYNISGTPALLKVNAAGTAWISGVTGADIAANSITAGLVDASIVTTAYLTANYLTATTLVATYASLSYLAANYITASSIAATYVSTTTLTANYATIASLSTVSLSANQIKAGNLNVGPNAGYVGLISVNNVANQVIAQIGTIVGSGGPWYGVWAANFWAGGTSPGNALITLNGTSGSITGCSSVLAANGITTTINNETRFGWGAGIMVDDATTTSLMASTQFAVFHDSSSFCYASIGSNGATGGILILNDSSSGDTLALSAKYLYSAPSGGGTYAIPAVARAFLEITFNVGTTQLTGYVPVI